MDPRKERELGKFKADNNPDKCLAVFVLKLRADKFSREYKAATDRLKTLKVKSAGWQKQLDHVRKLHNKMQAVMETLREIETIRVRQAEMIEVKINERRFFRFFATDYELSCKGKVPYSESAARQAAIETSEKFGAKMEDYKCRHCEWWHVGHAVE